MALINCPECDKQISDKASACINCGHPIVKTTSQHGLNIGDEQPIELTAKRLKLISFLSFGIFVLGIIIVAASTSESSSGFGVLLIILGCISYIINRIRIWWHHK